MEEVAQIGTAWGGERERDAAQDAAFSAMVERQARLMYRVAYALLKRPQDAEDAVQETLLKLYRTGGWREMADERAFLARSVWRVGLNRLAGSGAKAMRHAEDVAGMELPSAAPSPEQAAVQADTRRLISRLMDELPEGFREALVLSAIEGMRAAQVAEVLGIAEATVRTRVMRAKTELRRRFLEISGAGPSPVREVGR